MTDRADSLDEAFASIKVTDVLMDVDDVLMDVDENDHLTVVLSDLSPSQVDALTARLNETR